MRAFLHALTATVLTVPLAACSVVVGGGGGGSGQGASSNDVVLLTHDSFALPKKVIADFDRRSGYHLIVRSMGDGGALTNKLVLTQGNPAGDVAFGVDNTFASRALDAGVFAPYDAHLPAGAAAYRLPGDVAHTLTPVDNGNVCVNVDTTWFKAHHQAPPSSLADLIKPEYSNLLALPGATTSSTGLAFLLGTIGAYGDKWTSYWKALLLNGAQVTDGWEQAYEVDFTQGGRHGTRPIVVSYDSSPAFTVQHGTSTTKALLDTCFRQVEYVGVLDGAKNTAGAQALVDFLLTDEVQRALPDSMYVFPVRAATKLPTEWAKFAVQPTQPYDVSPAEISQHRDGWLTQWDDLVTQ